MLVATRRLQLRARLEFGLVDGAGVEDAAPAPPAATSEPSPFFDCRRQQNKSRMPTIAAPATEATPMPALAPVERPLAEFSLPEDPSVGA